MNVLYLHTHDMGRWLSPYGYAIQTPHLQTFAERATVFENAHCAAPTCSPSRAAMLTGQSAHATGMLGLAHRGFSLANPERHLGNVLREQGFRTALSGIQHEFHGEDPPGYPYHETLTAGFDDVKNADAAAEWLRNAPPQPFFLSVGMFYPHRPFLEPAAAGHLPPPAHLPETPGIRKDLDAYAASMAVADEAIGRVLHALQESGLADETIVLVTTDHGPAFPGMKCTLSDHGTGVALMMDYPGNPARGQRRSQMVSHLDVFPTLCDLLSLDRPDWLEGYSLKPVFEDASATIRDELFAEINFHAARQPQRSVRTERYKYMQWFDGHDRLPPANVDGGPAKDFFREHGFLATPEDPVQLYDLFRDPAERVNRADDPTCAAVREHMQGRLRAWMERTDDPLLKGPLVRPKTGIINTSDAPEPSDQGPFEDDPAGLG